MWPMFLDMSRDECKRFLRRLELDAYGSIVSALRAQGEFSGEKQKLLQDLSSILNISMERHKAEVRRAVNDEKLATVAEQMSGPNSATGWAIEGRRLIPLLPRLVPQTAFTSLANNVANITAAENANLPPPALTVKTKETGHDLPPQHEPNVPEAAKTPAPIKSDSPVPSNAVMLPPGTSIQLKKDDADDKTRKRRRSVSTEGHPLTPTVGLPPTKIPALPHPQTPGTRLLASYPGSMNPVKITSCRPTASTQSSTPKVIIVSTSSTSGTSNNPSILQRSLSVPMVKTVSAAGSSIAGQQRGGSFALNNPVHSTGIPVTSSNVVTITTNPTNINQTTVVSKADGAPATTYIAALSGAPKIRPMTVQLPAKSRPRTNAIMIPMTPNLVAGPVAPHKGSKSNVNQQIKSESTNMKSVTVAAKILPKPSFVAGSSSPMYVVATNTSSSVPIISRAVPTNIPPRVVTVNTNTAAPATPTIHSIVTNTPKQAFKSVQKVHLGSGVRTNTGKTNVIVVQKGSTSGYARGVTLAHGGKEVPRKVAVSKPPNTSRGQISATMTVRRPSATLQLASKPPSIQLPSNSAAGSGNVIVLDLSHEQLSKNTVLADILQASGILVDESSATEVAGTTSSSEKQDTEPIAQKDENLHYYETSTTTVPDSSEVVEPVSVETEKPQPPEVSAGRVVTLEEAVALLGQNDCPETRALLSQAGIEVTDQHTYQASESTTMGSVDSSIQQVVHEEDVVSMEHDNVMEVIGELDPQTGIYSIHSAVAGGSSETNEEDRSTKSQVDIFSTALASADIQLDTFHYMDDGLDQLHAAISSESASKPDEYSSYSETTGDQEGDSVSKQVTVEEPSPVETTADDHYTVYLQPTNAECENTAVMVEPSHMDTTEMYIEDFSSQKM